MPANIESQHLIHPTTLDVILHSLPVALGENGELDFDHAAVPVFCDSLIVAADLPSGAGLEFRGFCTARRLGPREIVADICYSDSAWTEPKVYIRGLHCLWKPDIHFSTQRSMEQYVYAEHSDVTVLVNCARYIVDLVAHKNPDISILQLGASLELRTKILSLLTDGSTQGTKRYSKYTVAVMDSPDAENSATSSENSDELVSKLTLKTGYGRLWVTWSGYGITLRHRKPSRAWRYRNLLSRFGEFLDQVETRAVSLGYSREAFSSRETSTLALREFSGVVKTVGRDCQSFGPGDLVCGYDGGSYRSVFTVDESQCQRIPAAGSFQEAVTWSLTFVTAYQAFIKIGQLRAGNVILIQDASSGIGQAAIQVALVVKAHVFATARSEAESQLIEKYEIPTHHIFNETDPYLADTIARLIANRGFDLFFSISHVKVMDYGNYGRWLPLHSEISFMLAILIMKMNVLDIGPF
ncbi:uncharacterized protein A1O9_03609 [Exophiala aquamarina CBS 119918]|uniref:Enoyl reductase (ER) domain-containing protein n=1 Tax=Exophiala aquamarina CBS 119918 TaxID=1182545 RepID=A0A072PG24_9EURO|nr:uncharacterized protein A1O9_03609 [Exophiala aquamarina CBS 119918]KEF58766.1 hypothetical protein A1O9_03609 [Exophiala aquamarina CBS 119918]